MNHNYLLSLAAAITFTFPWSVATVQAATARENDTRTTRITDFHAKNESLVTILAALGRKTGLSFAIEDVPKGDATSLSAVRLDYATKDSTIKDVLDELKKKTGAFTWHRDGNTINVIDVALKNNPFDENVDALQFKGASWDFLSLMNRKVTSLEAVQLSFEHSTDDNVVSIKTKETMTARKVFNRFAAKAGLRWHAQVGPREAPNPAPHLLKRTIVTFMPINR